jgi:hypothetical protein
VTHSLIAAPSTTKWPGTRAFYYLCIERRGRGGVWWYFDIFELLFLFLFLFLMYYVLQELTVDYISVLDTYPMDEQRVG